MRKIGPVQEKMLLLLLGGVALSLTHSPRQYFRTLKAIHRDWKKIDRQQIPRVIRRLHQTRLVTESQSRDGTVTLTLTPAGRKAAWHCRLRNITFQKPKRWDKQWRIVLFDIPEEQRTLRDIFRRHLKRIGFYEFQKSVFILPYDCQKEMLALIELYEAGKYVRFIQATHINNAQELYKHFSLKEK